MQQGKQQSATAKTRRTAQATVRAEAGDGVRTQIVSGAVARTQSPAICVQRTGELGLRLKSREEEALDYGPDYGVSDRWRVDLQGRGVLVYRM